MKLIQFVASVIVFCVLSSCSEPQKKNQIEQTGKPEIVRTNQSETITTESKSLDEVSENKTALNPDLLEKELENLLKSPTTKKIKVQEHGGGDCYGGYSIYYNQNSKQKAVLDKYDCGDYGYASKQFFLTNDKLRRIRSFKFEYYGEKDDSTIFKVEEQIFYFNNNQVLLKSRKKQTKDFSDSILTDINFSEKLLPADSVYKAKEKELKEVLASTLLED